MEDQEQGLTVLLIANIRYKFRVSPKNVEMWTRCTGLCVNGLIPEIDSPSAVT